MKKSVLWILAAVCFAQTAFAQETIPAASAPSTASVSPRGYLVGPGDVIEGKVLGEPDFNFTATVDEDGNFEVPFFDKPVPALCRTEKDLRADVTKLVAKYVRSPQVSVQVKERKSRPPVTVSGEVRQQQQVILTRQARLLELLSFAGGPTEKAGGMIQIFRTQPLLCSEPNELEKWKVESNNGLDVPSRMYSLASIRQGREESNPLIHPGDLIVVQKASVVYVVGEVIRPSELSIPEGGLPLTQAVAMAGGITREAKTKDIKVYRRKEGSAQPEVIVASYEQIRKGQQKDMMLEPSDIVEVDKAKKKIGDYFVDFLIGLPSRVPIRPL
jgi:polysaccharide biosynthesis/export protein